MRGAQIAAVLAAGADAAQLGTAFLVCPESGANVLHKQALTNPLFVRTELTRAFSGRPARGLVNRFMREHGPYAPAAYPQVHQLTAGLRKAAAEAGDPQGMALWAGPGPPARPGAPGRPASSRCWSAELDDAAAELTANTAESEEHEECVMTAPVFVVDTVPGGGEFVLDGAEGRHAVSVKRLRADEEVTLTDGAGNRARRGGRGGRGQGPPDRPGHRAVRARPSPRYGSPWCRRCPRATGARSPWRR